MRRQARAGADGRRSRRAARPCRRAGIAHRRAAQGEGCRALRRRGPAGGPGLCGAGACSTIARGRIVAHRHGSGGGRARRRAGDDARERAADEGAADADQAPRPRRGGQANLPMMQDDRVHWNGQPIARRARRDAGAGRPRGVADRGGLCRRAGQPRLRGGQGRGQAAGQYPGRAGRHHRSATRRRPWLRPASGSTRPIARRATTTTPSSCTR